MHVCQRKLGVLGYRGRVIHEQQQRAGQHLSLTDNGYGEYIIYLFFGKVWLKMVGRRVKSCLGTMGQSGGGGAEGGWTARVYSIDIYIYISRTCSSACRPRGRPLIFLFKTTPRPKKRAAGRSFLFTNISKPKKGDVEHGTKKGELDVGRVADH